MNLQLSDDQKLIQASVQDYFGRAHGFETYLARLGDGGLPPSQVWDAFRDMGWLGILVPEAAGGLGLGPQELMLVMEGMGASLCVEPLLSTVLCGAVLAESDAGQAAQTLAAALGGSERIALAWKEPRASLMAPWSIEAAVGPGSSGLCLSGSKQLVCDAAAASWLLVSARDGSGQAALWLVPATAQGVRIVDVRMVDGRHRADVEFRSVAVQEGQRVLAGPAAELALRTALYRGLAATCGQALGAMQRVLEITRAYLHERRQFGRALAEFQVLQHRIADMAMGVERARSMAYLAAIRADEAGRGALDALRDLSMAKFVVGRCGREVGAQGIQLHGGMGMALEYPVGHYYRSLLAVDAAFGSADEHLAFLADTLGSR